MSNPPADRWATTLTKRFLRAELKAGRTPKETAAQVGCSENTVRDHLVRHGLLGVSGAPKSLAGDYERLGSITAVANFHGASFATVRRWLLGVGVQLNEAHRPASAELDVRKAALRYESGQSLAEIATDLGVGVNTLKRRLVARQSRQPPGGFWCNRRPHSYLASVDTSRLRCSPSARSTRRCNSATRAAPRPAERPGQSLGAHSRSARTRGPDGIGVLCVCCSSRIPSPWPPPCAGRCGAPG